MLLLFIGIGMLAGSEGIGGIGFSDYRVAHGIATLGLAIILFDGGLRTSVGKRFRRSIKLCPKVGLFSRNGRRNRF